MVNLIRIIIILFATNFSYGQISFFNYYSDNGVDRGEGIVQLEDSSYVVTGSSSSFTSSSQAFLMKVDSLGNYIWSNHYGGLGSESSRRVLYKKGVGFYICGYTNSFGNGGFDYYLAKTDTNGTLEWEKSYGGTGWEKIHDAIMVKDTGAILVGETSSNPSENKNIYIVRTDVNGDTLWTKTIGGTGDDYANSIIEFNDSTYFVAGQYFNEDSLLTKAWLARIKLDGTVEWEYNYGENQNYWINDLLIDGTFVKCFGGNEGVGIDGIDSYSSLVTLSGTYWGGYAASDAGDNEYVGATYYGDSTYFYTLDYVENSTTYPIGHDVFVSKIMNPFTWQENFFISHEQDDVANQIIQTIDGAAIIVGYSTNFISGGNELYVCKIGPNDVYPDANVGYSVGNIVTVEEEIIYKKVVEVFPNPSSGLLTIKSDKNVEKVTVINMMGEIVFQKNIGGCLQFDLSILSNGTYTMLIEGDGVFSRKKVIIRH